MYNVLFRALYFPQGNVCQLEMNFKGFRLAFLPLAPPQTQATPFDAKVPLEAT